MGSHTGGVRIDMTVKSDMAKCVEGQFEITEDDLGGHLSHGGEDSSSNPHLNKYQAIEIAFLISERMRRWMGILPLTASGANDRGP